MSRAPYEYPVLFRDVERPRLASEWPPLTLGPGEPLWRETPSGDRFLVLLADLIRIDFRYWWEPPVNFAWPTWRVRSRPFDWARDA